MKKYILILILAVLTCASCSQKLEVAPPSNVTDEQIKELLKEDPDQVLAPMVSSIIDRLAVGEQNYASYTTWQCFNLAQSMKGNDLVHLNNDEFYMNDYRLRDYRESSVTYNGWYWDFLYRNVYLANQILKLIDDETLTDTEVGRKMKQYKASGLTLRAFSYIYLMWIYADDYLVGNAKLGIPMYAPKDGEVSLDPVERSTSEAVWTAVVTDLVNAVQLFKEAKINPLTATNDIDLLVADALLARAAISAGQWDKVIAAADDVRNTMGGWNLMNEDQYVGGPMKRNGFCSLQNNTEKILGWDCEKTYHNGVFNGTSFAGWMNIYGAGYGGQYAQTFHAIDSRLYDQISDNDYRKKNFLSGDILYTYVGSGTSEAAPVRLRKYFNQKFGTALSSDGTLKGKGNYLQDEVILRTSEVLLLKAEAQYRAGDENGARTTLEELTTARGASPVTETGDALYKRIQLESRIELWGENGSEYYNNKRWGKGVDRTGSENHSQFPVVQPGTAFTWQIPTSEVNYNPSIQQNP